jgi:hypothetical protein
VNEVLVSVVAGVFGLLSIVAQQLLARARKDMQVVKEQVANSHGTNLRDDLDFIRDLVLDVKTDVAWVRRDHLDLSHRVALLEGEPA